MNEMINGRGQFGQFERGNKLSIGNAGGNPNGKRMGELKRALIGCGTEEDIQKLYKTLMAAALGGDVQAAKLLLDHLVGRPSQSIELTGMEQNNGQLQITLTHVATKHDAGTRHPDSGMPSEPRSLPE